MVAFFISSSLWLIIFLFTVILSYFNDFSVGRLQSSYYVVVSLFLSSFISVMCVINFLFLVRDSVLCCFTCVINDFSGWNAWMELLNASPLFLSFMYSMDTLFLMKDSVLCYVADVFRDLNVGRVEWNLFYCGSFFFLLSFPW